MTAAATAVSGWVAMEMVVEDSAVADWVVVVTAAAAEVANLEKAGSVAAGWAERDILPGSR